MDAPANATAVARYRSWVAWRDDQPWRYSVGFDAGGQVVRFEVKGSTRAGPQAQLALAWRTTQGLWMGRYRYDDGDVTTPLSPIEVDLIENGAKTVRG